jgi:hypothetical protein
VIDFVESPAYIRKIRMDSWLSPHYADAPGEIPHLNNILFNSCRVYVKRRSDMANGTRAVGTLIEASVGDINVDKPDILHWSHADNRDLIIPEF